LRSAGRLAKRRFWLALVEREVRITTRLFDHAEHASLGARWACLLRRLIPTLGLALLLSACGTTIDREYPRTSSSAIADPQSTAVGALFQQAADRHPGQSGFAVVREGSRAFIDRLAMADLAEKTLDAQYYIWDGDTTGLIMAEWLLRAADRGVRVRLLLDDIYQTEERDFNVAAIDAHPNIQVRLFNPLANRRWRIWSFASDFARANHRMHNKLFIMDNAVGIAGGRNIADIYFGVRSDENFRDIDMAMAGPIVRDLSASFDEFWNSESAIPAAAVVKQRATEKDLLAVRKRLAEAISTAGYPYPIDEKIAALREQIVAIRDGFVWAPGRVIANSPTRPSNDDSEVIRDALVQRAGETKRELLVESPYFILADSGIELLRQLASRGVKVCVLTNSAATNDVIGAQAGYANTRKKLLNAGIELYELRPDSDMKREWSVVAGKSRAALHSKILVFDRESVFVGSPNLDPRSRAINTEIGVLVDSPEIARQAAEFVDEGMAPGSAYHVTLDKDGDLMWTDQTDGTNERFGTDPETSWWQRFVLDVIGVLPLEQQL
jgi:cardiolipin synthase C